MHSVETLKNVTKLLSLFLALSENNRCGATHPLPVLVSYLYYHFFFISAQMAL